MELQSIQAETGISTGFAQAMAHSSFGAAMGMLTAFVNPIRNQSRGVPDPDSINEDRVRSTKLDIETSESTENGVTTRTIAITGTYRDNSYLEVAQSWEATIESYWQGEFASGDGTKYVLTTNVSAFDRENLQALLRGSNFEFRRGRCAERYACANSGTGQITIQDWFYFRTDSQAVAHEFGHVLGFDHFRNGTGNIQNYDDGAAVQLRNVELLWERHH